MTDYGNNNQKQAPYTYANVPPRGNETALMIEGLYNGIAYDLQKMKKERAPSSSLSRKRLLPPWKPTRRPHSRSCGSSSTGISRIR